MVLRAFNSHHPRVDPTAYVDDSAVVIGDVAVGPDASVWSQVVVRGDVQSIVIGARTNVQDGAILHVTPGGQRAPGGAPLLLGADVTVGHRVILHACTIGDHCLIGMGAMVMDGAVLRPRVMLGAGSLVASGAELEGEYLWLGCPARRVRPLTDQEREMIECSAAHYVRLKTRHAPQPAAPPAAAADT